MWCGGADTKRTAQEKRLGEICTPHHHHHHFWTPLSQSFLFRETFDFLHKCTPPHQGVLFASLTNCSPCLDNQLVVSLICRDNAEQVSPIERLAVYNQPTLGNSGSTRSEVNTSESYLIHVLFTTKKIKCIAQLMGLLLSFGPSTHVDPAFFQNLSR